MADFSLNFNPSISELSKPGVERQGKSQAKEGYKSLAQTGSDMVKDVNNQGQDANASITDLLTGKTEDIHSVVANVARSDMSFKMLVGVRNKLITAYQETMKMQV